MQKQEAVIKNPKDNIIVVALRVFGRLGVYKTTMNDIAKAAKKGRRTIYQYFKSKEEIYQAVLEKETAKMVVPMKAIVKSELKPEEKLRSYAHQRIASIYKIAENHHAFKVGFIHNDKVILKLRKRFDRFDSELLLKIIEEGIQEGVFKGNDSELMVKNIQVGLRGMEIDFIKNNLNENCKKQLDLYIEMITKGIAN
ncbi:MAG: TetR/AcrR family transcriptional regulator [Bacteroidetes bacterium]|nr:TetR/AcrR family transcriptional regulator [Bacteroidota bacterium]